MKITKNVPVTVDVEGEKCGIDCKFLDSVNDTCLQYDIKIDCNCSGDIEEWHYDRCDACVKEFGNE